MDFDGFLHWLNSNCKERISRKTLGGKAEFKAEVIENGRLLLIEYSRKNQICCLNMEKLKLIFDRYHKLDDKKHMTSEYADPKWPETPSRICAPYAAALIRDFESDYKID